jgi:hypothetical protein
MPLLKPFVLCTKGHTGYYSCFKCITEGEYFKAPRAKRGHIVFSELTAKLREEKDIRFGERENIGNGEEEERGEVIATRVRRKHLL